MAVCLWLLGSCHTVWVPTSGRGNLGVAIRHGKKALKSAEIEELVVPVPAGGGGRGHQLLSAHPGSVWGTGICAVSVLIVSLGTSQL